MARDGAEARKSGRRNPISNSACGMSLAPAAGNENIDSVQNQIGEDFASRMAITLTADRVFGSVLTLQECEAALREFHINGVVERIALLLHVNARVFMDSDTPKDKRRNHLAQFARFMFEQVHFDKVINEIVQDPERFRPLSDQALLATLELALTVCRRDDGRRLDCDADRTLLSHVVLSFQTDLFSPRFTAKIHSIGATTKSWNDLSDEDFAEFVRNRAAHNTQAYYRRAVSRLFGFCCEPEINSAIQKRMGISIENWFQEVFGISPPDYFRLAFTLIAVAQRLNEAKPDARDLFFNPKHFFSTIREPERSHLLSLVELSTQRAEDPRAAISQEPISEYLYRATRFFVKPILEIGAASVCVSPTLLMNKFLTGLPFLALESKRRNLARDLTKSEVDGARAPFGHLFESYVGWLIRKWLDSWKQTEVISPYYIRSNSKGENPERDLVIVRRDAAFAFEVKASVARLQLRQKGSFGEIDRVVMFGAMQARTAAEALQTKKAFRSDGTPIVGIRRVIPCVITYETIPLFPPLSDCYERHLEQTAGMRLFGEADGIYPLQFFDIDFLESWESQFDLSPECGSPFGYLETRARNPYLRYREIDSRHVVGSPRPESPRPFENLVRRSFYTLESEIRLWLSPEARVK